MVNGEWRIFTRQQETVPMPCVESWRRRCALPVHRKMLRRSRTTGTNERVSGFVVRRTDEPWTCRLKRAKTLSDTRPQSTHTTYISMSVVTYPPRLFYHRNLFLIVFRRRRTFVTDDDDDDVVVAAAALFHGNGTDDRIFIQRIRGRQKPKPLTQPKFVMKRRTI